MRKDFPEAAPASTSMQAPIGFLNLVKVVHESVPIQGGGTGTLGSAVDEAIGAALANGEELQEITLEISKEYWFQLKMGAR